MENVEISKKFEEVANILELMGESNFRVSAYRRAARLVLELPEELKLRKNMERLRDIPGIGEAIADKIVELEETESMQFLLKLRKEPVAQLIELTKISGVGPKHAKLFYDRLGVMTVADLEREAKLGTIKKLPGMKEKSELNIIKGIEQYRRFRQRFRIDQASFYAEMLLKKITEQKYVLRAEIAGSLRRGKETIGDVDILVITEKPLKVINYFVTLPEVDEIIAKGETKASVLLAHGLQVDLRVLPREDFGAAWIYFTGSKEHNILLRSEAIKQNCKLSEYGLFKGEKEKKMKISNSERGIYRKLGLNWIPPVLREASGELDYFKKNKKIDLIELKDIKGDLQMHSNFSDGKLTLAELKNACIDLGYEYMAITDHIQKGLEVTDGLTREKIVKQFELIDKLNFNDKNFKILKGAEINILKNGDLSLEDDLLALLDVVLVGIHGNMNMERDEMTNRIIVALENKYTNLLAHPTGRLINKRDSFNVDIERVLKAAKANKVIVEINASPMRLDLKDIHVRMAMKMGVDVAINTDAHSAIQLKNMKYGVLTARRGWALQKNIVNSWSLKKLMNRLKKK